MNERSPGLDDEFRSRGDNAARLFNIADDFVVGGVALRRDVTHDVAAFAVEEFGAGISGFQGIEGWEVRAPVSAAGEGGGDEFGGDGGEIWLEVIDAEFVGPV